MALVVEYHDELLNVLLGAFVVKVVCLPTEIKKKLRILLI